MLKRHVTAWADIAGPFRFRFLQPPEDSRRLEAPQRRSGHRQLAHVWANLRRPSVQSAEPDQRADGRQAGTGLEPRTRHHARSGSDAAGGGRRHLHHRLLERGVRDRRKDRRSPLDLRSQGASRTRLFHLLRRGESRRGALPRQGVRGNARRPPDRARRADRHAGLDCATRPTAPSPIRSPALPASPREWWSSATPAPSLACAATSRPTTPKPARWPGASTPCPAIPRRGSNRRPWKPPPRPGTANGGRPAAAARHGKASSTTLRSTCCTSEPATPPRGTARCAARATVCTPRRSWPCTPATANSPGIFKPRPGTTGTSMPRSR